nr:type I-D CRISPR-associated helicase Cas3' [Candidatus Njordarchaeota archaeon]
MILLRVSEKRLKTFKEGDHPLIDTFNRMSINAGGRDLSPYAHQIGMFDAMHNNLGSGTICISNTCGTGLGKTYSVALPILLNEYNSFLVYPTNALIHDQYDSVLELKKMLYPSKDLRIRQCTSFDLACEAGKEGITDHRVILDRLLGEKPRNQKIIITNPDILYLSLSLGYERKVRTHLIYPIIDQFDVFCFDEFHLYDWKQLFDILFFMKLLSEDRRNRRTFFIFLSATPNIEFLEEAKRIIPVDISIIGENYCVNNDFIKKEEKIVVGDVTLRIEECSLGFEWITQQENLQSIMRLIEERKDLLLKDPKSKIVIILNSVYGAKKVRKVLETELGKIGISIGAWHGLNTYTRSEEKDKCVIVGTQAIEVGVDFKAITLIFEADSAASFMQRFGRVARVAGKPEWVGQKFDAIALVPSYAYNGLMEKLHIQEGRRAKEITREELEGAVNYAFEDYSKFRNFTRMYSPVEHYAIAEKYVSDALDPDKKWVKDFFHQKIIEELYPQIDMEKVRELYRFLEGSEILDELRLFRGGSVHAIFHDQSEDDAGRFPLQIYPLTYVLRHYLFRVVSGQHIRSLAKQYKDQWNEACSAFEYDCRRLDKFSPKPLYLEVTEQKGRPVNFIVKNTNDIEIDEVRRSRGFYLERIRTKYDKLSEEELKNWSEIKRHLQGEELTYLVTEKDQSGIRSNLKLSPYFELFEFKGSTESEIMGSIDVEGTITFGLNALLIHSQMLQNQSD